MQGGPCRTRPARPPTCPGRGGDTGLREGLTGLVRPLAAVKTAAAGYFDFRLRGFVSASFAFSLAHCLMWASSFD